MNPVVTLAAAVAATFPRYWKALIGFVAPGAVLIGSAVLEPSAGGTAITTGEWVTAAVACVVTSAGVATKGNRAYHADELDA